MEFDETKKNDKEYVLEMVKNKGSLLDYASSELKDDKEVVMLLKNYKNVVIIEVVFFASIKRLAF